MAKLRAPWMRYSIDVDVLKKGPLVYTLSVDSREGGFAVRKAFLQFSQDVMGLLFGGGT